MMGLPSRQNLILNLSRVSRYEQCQAGATYPGPAPGRLFPPSAASDAAAAAPPATGVFSPPLPAASTGCCFCCCWAGRRGARPSNCSISELAITARLLTPIIAPADAAGGRRDGGEQAVGGSGDLVSKGQLTPSAPATVRQAGRFGRAAAPAGRLPTHLTGWG